jgi:phosphatidylglycerophosphate synthase
MLIVSILTAVLGGLLRGKEELEESGTGAATFVVIALVAPLAVLIVISTVNGLVAAWKALRRRR